MTDEEIKQVLKDMPNDKAPAIDGFLAEFFRTYWGTIEEEVIKVVKEFFENGKLLKNVNSTTVTLVPKVSSPSYVKEF